MHADHASVCLPGANRHAVWYRNVPGVVVTIIFALPPIIRLRFWELTRFRRI